jgi:hypothetical protein
MKTMDRAQVEADRTARGFRGELWVEPPGWRWEEFTHATDEPALVLEGAMAFAVEGRVVRPVVGEKNVSPRPHFQF